MEKLGEGGEAEVFAIDEHQVLRRFREADHPSVDERVALTREIAAGAGGVDFLVPEILDTHVDDEGRACFVERRLPGRSMTDALGEVTGRRREVLLQSYLSTAASIRSIRLDRPWFGELARPDPLRCETWVEYLVAALDRQVAKTDADDYPEIDDLGAAVDEIREPVRQAPAAEPALVHFDYFPGNVLCDDTRITAVIDWSVLSISGDPDLDVALAVSYLGVTPTATADDRAFGERWLAERGLADRARTYERWAAAWWSPLSSDETLRRWVASVLGRPG